MQDILGDLHLGNAIDLAPLVHCFSDNGLQIVPLFAGDAQLFALTPEQHAARERARERMAGYPPSSPAMGLFKNGEQVFMLQRTDLQEMDQAQTAAALRASGMIFLAPWAPSDGLNTGQNVKAVVSHYREDTPLDFSGFERIYDDDNKQELQLVESIDLDIGEGEIFGFLGPNGAGKSTTLKIATGYLSPSEGTISINGKDVQTDILDIKKEIGYLPEHNPLYHDMYVHEFLQFSGKFYNLKGKKLKTVSK